MSEQKTIAKMTGYKATDKNMCCNGYRFEIGKWSEPVAAAQPRPHLTAHGAMPYAELAARTR